MISVLIEWENVLLAEGDRCCEMLHRLRAQVREIVEADGTAFEILVLFNPEQIDGGAVRGVLGEHLVGDGLPNGVSLRLEPAVGEHYYDLRNVGARLATGEVLVCVDSDVIPEPGWLRALLTPMLAADGPGVVTGQTYLDNTDLVSWAFGAGWFFPVRDPSDEVLRESPMFFANNIAFRREVLLAHPYPALQDGQTRGSCAQLAKNLRAAGVGVWHASGARATHPAPNGWRHIGVRALAQGRDISIEWKMKGRSRLRRTLRAVSWSCTGVRRTLIRGCTKREQLRMPVWQIVPAVAIMAWYYGLSLVGAWTVTLLPARFSRGWRV